MAKRDYYEVLGLTNTATSEEIKKAYRTKALETHPDKGGDEAEFKEVAEAYEILSDPDKKANYDAHGHAGPQQSFNPDAAFQEFLRRAGFGGMQQQSRAGINLPLIIKLTMDEIFTGVIKKFKYNRKAHCTVCGGKGGTNPSKCNTCQGYGRLTQVQNMGYGQIHTTMMCPDCQGEGTKVTDACLVCHGEGVVSLEETVEIQIPAGVTDAMTVNMVGKGDAVKNGGVGNMIATIVELPHEKFVRNGDNLKLTAKVTYPELILGDKIEIPTIDGGKIRVQVPELSKIGDILKINDKGLKNYSTQKRGDLFITLDLLVPANLTDEERKLIEELKKITKKVAI